MEVVSTTQLTILKNWFFTSKTKVILRKTTKEKIICKLQ